MIVGIGHVARTGKDTAANVLVQHLGFKRVGFADKLKELALATDPLVAAVTGVMPQNVGIGHGRLRHVVKGMGWESAKDAYPEVRTFLQSLGQAGREVFGEDFWVEQALARIKPTDRVVIPDVRHFNEADAIRAVGGKVIRIDRPGFLPAGHISETALAGYEHWDATVDNVGSVIDLQDKVLELVRKWVTVDE